MLRKVIMGAALLSTAACTTSQLEPGLVRVATVPLGAEITGMYITDNGDLFYNAQHPADSNAEPNNRAAIGAVAGVDMRALPASIEPIGVPKTAEEKQGFSNAFGEYQVIAREGDFEDIMPGGLGAILAADGQTKIKQSNDPDFNAYIPASDDGNTGYLFTNWEDRPGGMSRIHVAKGEDGNWSVGPEGAMAVDFSAVGGTWVNCFGSVSPWNTPLTSEELYVDETADWNNPDFDDYGGITTLGEHIGRAPNPYDYGFIVELTDPTGTPTPVKHFTMGRYSHENAVVMPDQKTAYLSDDGSGVVFFKFVADEAGDLSSGTLYAAKATQGEGDDSATVGFDIEWVELAHGDNATIESWVREYDGATTAAYVEGETNYISDQEIADWAAGNAADDRVAFLESRKAAAAKGATAEFRKMEGVMINHDAAADGSVPYVYMAMSEIGKTMADEEGDVQLAENKCGVVYQMRLDDNFDVNRMEPAVAGFGYDEGVEVNQCSVDGISNPDNLLILDDGRVLIGEDTGNHENNMMWVWTPEAGTS